MNLHYKDHHHHQRYCKCAQKIHLLVHKFSRLGFTRQSCTYKVKVIMFVAIEMLTFDTTGSHFLTKTAVRDVWKHGLKCSRDHCVRTAKRVSKRPIPAHYRPPLQMCDKRWITGKLNSVLGLLISELQSGRLSSAITQHHVVFDHLAIQYLPVTDLTKVTGKARKVRNTHTYNKR